MFFTKHSDKIARITIALLLSAAAISLVSCNDTEAWDDMPDRVATFVSTYFPAQEVDSYGNHGNIQTVYLHNGPTLYFNEQSQWIKLDGNGVPLPSILATDLLPSPFLNYLQGLGALDDIIIMQYNYPVYTVTLSDSTIAFDEQSGEIKYVTANEPPLL
ncbi:MAG: hypothetical protein J6D01_02020 [Muribaculaceae bacterium]|nr:hypothetical protein [Muribaculaceae bacterium]